MRVIKCEVYTDLVACQEWIWVDALDSKLGINFEGVTAPVTFSIIVNASLVWAGTSATPIE